MPVIRKNKQQYRKVYPGIRKTPKYDTRVVLDQNLTMETGSALFVSNTEVTYTFTKTYTSTPTVTASLESVSAGDHVNIFISSISTTFVTFGASAINDGKVNLLVMGTSS